MGQSGHAILDPVDKRRFAREEGKAKRNSICQKTR